MDIISTYNPGNTNITDEEVAQMRNLTDEQIEQLAKAYPNQPTGNAYLEYWIEGEKENEQRFPLGTWANLHNLRKLGRKDISAFRFRRSFQPKKNYPVPLKTPQRIVDLSKQDVENAEGLKAKATTTTGGVKDVHIITQDDLNANPELEAAQKELQQAIDDKAHPNSIRAKQKKVNDLIGIKAGSGN